MVRMLANKTLYRTISPLCLIVVDELDHWAAATSRRWENQIHPIALIQNDEVMMRLVTNHQQRAQCKMVSKKNAAMSLPLSAATCGSVSEEPPLENTISCER